MAVSTSIRANPTGTITARVILSLLSARGDYASAANYADRELSWRSTPQVAAALRAIDEKALADPISSTGGGAALQQFGVTDDFARLLRDRSVLARLQPSMRRTMFQREVPVDETAAIASGWIPQDGGRPGPVTFAEFSTSTLDAFSHATHVVLSRELSTMATPSAEAVVIEIIRREVSRALDFAFLDPAVTAIPGDRPASITNAGKSHVSTGATAAQKAADIAAMIGLLESWQSPTWIMRKTTASALAATANTSGARQFPDIAVNGGLLEGIPVMTAQDMPSAIVLVDAGDVLYADDGDFDIGRTTQASIELDTNPTGGQGSPIEHAELVSLWQRNLVGLRLIKTVSWQLAHDGAVVSMEVSY